MTEAPFIVAVIIGSTRRGRFGPVVAEWYVHEVRDRSDLALDLIDLAEMDLPDIIRDFHDEPARQITALAPRLAAADAFVVVTPEYNHSYPASLKTAIDAYLDEWRAKPVAIISYGGAAGGVRAAEHLRQVFSEVHAMTIRETVSFHNIAKHFWKDVKPNDSERYSGAAKAMTDQLVWWAHALRVARHSRPYA